MTIPKKRALQLVVDMKSLGSDVSEAEEFLRPNIKGKIDRHGTELKIQDATAHDVKLLLHKFLHHKALDNYRVEVVHPGLLKIFQPERIKQHEHHRDLGSPPSAAVTLPYYFPSSPTLSGSRVKKKHKKTRKE